MGPLLYNLLFIVELYINVIYSFITGQYPM